MGDKSSPEVRQTRLPEVRRTEIFAAWFQMLRDKQARARIQVRIDRLMLGNAGDVRAVDGVSALRIDCGPGYRAYYVRRGNTLIVLLGLSCWPAATSGCNAGISNRRINWLEWRRILLAGIMTLPWKTEDHLATPEHIAAYLEAVFEDGDSALITHALGAVARSKGMTELARKTGRGRQSLYKALSEYGRPEFATVLDVVRALGLKLTVTAG
jgi:probable addiction module antidote protein/putative addiction module killer protein